MKKRPHLVVILLILITGFVFVGPDKSWSGQDKVLAKVGDQTLTLEEFNQQIQSLPPQLQMAVMRNPDLKKQLLKRWVHLTLMSLAAKKQGLENNAQVKKRIQDATNAILAQEYMMKNVMAKAKVTDKEAQEYYNSHKKEFMQKEQVKARHILIRVPANAPESKWEEAKKKALELRKKILGGEKFEVVAKKYSDDPGSKGSGGELGWFERGQMVPPFEKAAFALKKGQISQPVRTNFGYHLIQLEDRRPAHQRSFQEVKQEIKNKLIRQKQIQLRDQIVAKLEKQYPVTVHNELLSSGSKAHGNMSQGAAGK